MIDVTDTPHGLHLDIPGAPGLTLGSDETTAIVQHELGKLGLWWAEEQRALVCTRPVSGAHHVFYPTTETESAWISGDNGQSNTRSGQAVAAYLASLPAAPKPGETWELNPGDESFTAQVIEAPDGTICFVWHPFDEVAIRRVKGFFEGNRRKIADAPTTALDKVRGALAEHPRCDRHGGDDPVTCGWKSAVLDVQAALDGADS